MIHDQLFQAQVMEAVNPAGSYIVRAESSSFDSDTVPTQIEDFLKTGLTPRRTFFMPIEGSLT